MTIGPETKPRKNSRCSAFRMISFAAGVIVGTVVIGACSGQTTQSPETAGPGSSSAPAVAAARPSGVPSLTPKASGAPSLSSRSTAPLIVESVKTEFWEDYSFVTTSDVPLSQQALAAMDNTMNTVSDGTLVPPGVIVANTAWIDLTVAGNSTAPITINSMTVLKACQKPPPGGILFYSPSAGAGPTVVSTIYFNLDGPISIGQYEPPAGGTILPGGNFFAKEVITLRYQEPQTLAIFVTTRQYCRFSFALNVATVDGPVTETITDNGSPFTVTSDNEPSIGHIAPARVPFSSYAIVYAGGVSDMQNNGKFIRVNPATYQGTGNPASFPVP